MSVRILNGDCREMLRTLPDESVHCCVTSPPYWGLRDYGVDGQIGLERSPDAYVAEIVAVAREMRRVLRSDGTFWLNLGDSYASSGRGTGGSGIHSTKQTTNRGAYFDTHSLDRRSIVACGVAPKQLIGIPWRVAFALQADGWWLRQDIIWAKPNPMPESVTDRCTKAHEYIFLLSKSARYHFDAGAIAEPVAEATAPRAQRAQISDARADGIPGQPPHALHQKRDKQRGHSRRHAGFNDRWDAMERAEQCSGMRNKRDVWEVATQPYSEAHFATFPPALIEPCILAGCPQGGTVLDPFFGAGTTGLVCDRLNRNCIGIELNPEYAALAHKRIEGECPMFAEVA